MKNSKITVLFCFHDGNKNNGGNRSLIDVIDNLLEKKNIEILAAFPVKEGSAIEYLKSKNVYIVPFCYGRWDYHMEDYTPKNLYMILKTLKSFAYTYDFLYRIDSVINEFHINLIYTNTMVLPIGMLIKKKYGIPMIWHIREFGYEDHKLGIIGGVNRLYRGMNTYSDKIIMISKSLFDKYSKYVNPEKMQVIYDDISPEFIINQHQILQPNTKCNILIAGTIKPGKGQKEAIQVIQKIIKKGNRNVHLYIAGEKGGEYYKEILKYVQRYKLEENIHFLGYVTDMNSLRRQMDIALVASCSEAFGRVTVEAMLAGMLVIGADVAGTSELICDGVNGILYEAGNLESLEKTIETVIHDADKMRKIAQNGHITAINDYTIGKCSEEIYKIMQELVDEKSNFPIETI